MMDDYIISGDKSKLDITLIHSFITNAYWAKGRTYEEVKNTIHYSDCFGIYKNSHQVGFARVLSDYTVFAYLMDVFIISAYRGKGLSKKLLTAVFEDSKFKQVKKWMLATSDAHGLYEKFGFKVVSNPGKHMEKTVSKNRNALSNSVDN